MGFLGDALENSNTQGTVLHRPSSTAVVFISDRTGGNNPVGRDPKWKPVPPQVFRVLPVNETVMSLRTSFLEVSLFLSFHGSMIVAWLSSTLQLISIYKQENAMFVFLPGLPHSDYNSIHLPSNFLVSLFLLAEQCSLCKWTTFSLSVLQLRDI